MKVLCFGRFYDEIPGGMQRHVEQLFVSLSNRVEFVHLVPSRDRHGAHFSLHGVPVIRTPSLNLDGSLALSPGLILEAMRLQRRYRFDLIHLHFPDPMSHLASLALPGHIPRIISWHADIVRQKTLLRFYHPLLRRAIQHAAGLVVATPAHVTNSPDLSALADPARIHVIPYGFNLDPYVTPHPQTAAVRGRFPGKLIFALGRHVYYKGFDVLIQAMKAIDPDAHLVIGGVGPLTEQWRSLARQSGVADRVTFAGLIDETILPAYYQAAEVFCLPAVSQAEAFGIVQVEAMASGLPVISTNLNNGVDYVNQDGVSGLVVPPGNVDALVVAVNRILRDEGLRTRLGESARARAIGEFSMAAMADKMQALYERTRRQAPG